MRVYNEQLQLKYIAIAEHSLESRFVSQKPAKSKVKVEKFKLKIKSFEKSSHPFSYFQELV